MVDKTKMSFKELEVFHGIEWPITDMAYDRLRRQLESNPRRNETDVIKKVLLARELRNVVHGKYGVSVEVSAKDVYIITTPARQYRYFADQYAKADIVIAGRPDQAKECRNKLAEEKERALDEKQHLAGYLGRARSLLERLHDEGLIDGVIGRGSYFEKDGFPSQDDDVDLVLMRKRDFGEEELEKIGVILAQEKEFPVLFIPYKEGQEKVANDAKAGKPISLIFATESIVRAQPGIEYNRHVLETGPGIEIEGIPKAKSEALAHELLGLLNA